MNKGLKVTAYRHFWDTVKAIAAGFKAGGSISGKQPPGNGEFASVPRLRCPLEMLLRLV
jgi:hypothetical protein